MDNKCVIFWFRRDLRLEDQCGLHHALNSGFPVLPIFIFDREILDKLSDKKDRRVDYIHQSLITIQQELVKNYSSLLTFYGKPLEIFKILISKYNIHSVYCNKDFEPQAIRRDDEIKRFLKENSIGFKNFKDQTIFDADEILKKDNTPYTVYTPYSKQWIANLTVDHYKDFKIDLNNFISIEANKVHDLKDIGFDKTDICFSKPIIQTNIIKDYHRYRDFPFMDHTSKLGLALRFGTISIRKCVEFALQFNQTWLSELIWREFFMQILFHFPHVVDHSFKRAYDQIEWRNNEQEFQKWCIGHTGFPLVDAGMRQLNTTGYMHNRVRMVVASFLCKHLLIDWRWGEAYFASKLNDYDLSANNGNWQWAAGCGCDAAPYFRIFNPATQLERFDHQLEYVYQWVPEFGTKDYIKPIVDHQFARERVLQVYKKALNQN